MTNLNIINTNQSKGNIELPEKVSSEAVIEKENPQTNSLSGRLIGYLNQVDRQIDKTLPDNIFQKKLDQMVIEIKEKFAPLNQFSNWLSENESGDWVEQLASYLVKLPLRSARNIITFLYEIISMALYTSTHPLKGVNNLAKKMILLLNELTKPSSWAKIGCGSIGVLVGKSFILGNPLSLIGVGIGGALTLGGISIDAFQSAVNAETHKADNAFRKKLTSQIKQLPEAMLTGLFMGMLFGGIKRAARKPLEISKNTNIPSIDEKKYYNETYDCEYDWDKVEYCGDGEEQEMLLREMKNKMGYPE